MHLISRKRSLCVPGRACPAQYYETFFVTFWSGSGRSIGLPTKDITTFLITANKPCNIFKYKNKYYQPYLNNELKCFRPKTECLVIKSFSGDKIKILFTGEMKPFIVKDFDSDELLQLVLPVRTY